MQDFGNRPRRSARAIALAVAALLIVAGSAFAAVGLQNASFESGLAGWTAETVRENVYTGDTVEPATCAGAGRRGICAVGADTFTPAGGSAITVQPLDGSRMARLAGPFTSSAQDQELERYRLRQTFTVDPANPVVRLNYNVFLFDYQGFDRLRFTVSLTDAQGERIADFAQGGFGEGTLLKNTGWRSAFIDLTGYENQQITLTIDSGGTSDELYGFWSYLDAGEAPVRPVSPPTFQAPVNPETGQPVPVNTYGDPATGQLYITVPNSEVADFEDECMPLTLDVPIAAGNGTVSNVFLLFDGDSIPMTQVSPGIWRAVIDCVRTGDLAVQYTLTEGTDSETFVVPIGGLTLIDPAGVVYDQVRFDAARAAGRSEAAARAETAIGGATVRLQRKTGGVFRNVLSGDPGISPNLNPEITGANGQYQWLTNAGDYRVVVSKDGYVTTTSRVVTIPPEVTDLHVGMQPTTSPQPPDDDGDGLPNRSDQCPNVAAATPSGCPAPPPGVPAQPAVAGDTTAKKKACAGLKGRKRAACNRKRALAKAIATCRKQNKKKAKRALCIKRAKALSKCSAITGRKGSRKLAKKKKRCVAKAKRIGAKRKN